jgi:hypothetical protein
VSAPAYLRTVALVCSLLFAVTACTAEDPAGDERTSQEPTTPVAAATPDERPEGSTIRPALEPGALPQVGECRALSTRDIAAPGDDTPPVRCGRRHTAQTFSVDRIPRKVLADRSDPDAEAVAEYVTPRCERRFARWIGGDAETRTLSRLHTVWFLPTDREIRLGARWYRCDAIAYSEGAEPARLPRDVEQVLSTPGGLTEFGVCSQGSPERPDSVRVMCGRRSHDWRAFAAQRLGGRDGPFPGRRARREARAECRDASRAELGFPLEWRFGWQPPSREAWRTGARHDLCWVPVG